MSRIIHDVTYSADKSTMFQFPFPVRTQPGVDIHDLFLGGDVRTNEDWIMFPYVVPTSSLLLQLTPATLDKAFTVFLRKHNRLCDIVLGQHPDTGMMSASPKLSSSSSAKLALIGNSYQMAYWSNHMPWPDDDGFLLYPTMYGESHLSIDPAQVSL